MIYILSWILPSIISIGTIREFSFIEAWYLRVPMGLFLTILYRDAFINIYGVTVTYHIKLGEKKDE
jgi:hypothetical protein